MSHRKENGYIMLHIPNHPYASYNGSIPEHRVVIEKVIGRYVDPSIEDVHHINEIIEDNRPENLIVLTKSEHRRIHAGWSLKEGEWFKPCSTCERTLPFKGNFYIRSNGAPVSMCKDCCIAKSTRPKKRICEICGKTRFVSVSRQKTQNCRSCSAKADWDRRKNV
jgi:hypothetical protein